MALQLVLGRAGAGKTAYCLTAMRERLRRSPSGPALLLLVPEQATFQAEHALLADGLTGAMRAQVVGFRRLAYRVLEETGGAAKIPITDLGKRIILRRLLEQVRGQLRVFSRSADQYGFVDAVAAAITELKTYCITPAVLENRLTVLPEQNKLLADKMRDLLLLYQELEKFLQPRYTNPDDVLTLLAAKIPHTVLLRGAEVWVDGFVTFTPQEYAVLGAIMTTARHVTVTLCLDSRRPATCQDETALFYAQEQTRRKLLALARERSVEVLPAVVLDDQPRRFSSPALAHLERCLGCRRLEEYRGEATAIHVVAAANQRAEVEGAAREMLRLAREQGWRWRDMAVVVRDIDTYAELIRGVFVDYDLPFFIDRRRDMSHHPLLELIRAALEIVNKNWSYEGIFRFLKTDLALLSRQNVDLLENYVLAHGLKGTQWTDGRPWRYRRRALTQEEGEAYDAKTARELAYINALRLRVVRLLAPFIREVRTHPDVVGVTTALYNLLQRLKVPQTLAAWAQASERAGRLDDALAHNQVWQGVMDVFDQLVEAFGREVLPLPEYANVLEAGLANLRLGLIPPGLDQVFVSSLERSRLSEVKAAFVLGVNDGVLPARHGDSGLFSDTERIHLEQAGMPLAPGARQRLFAEQYLAYVAFSRASKYLWLSYPLLDTQGEAQRPSYLVRRVLAIFPNIKEEFLPGEPDGVNDARFVAHPRRALSFLATRLRAAKNGQPIAPLWRQVYNWARQQPSLREPLRNIVAGLLYTNQERPLTRQTSRALYGPVMRASISKLEQYRACPFAHFLTYGLHLQERAVYKLSAPDLGQLFHAALKLIGDRLARDGCGWESLSHQNCRDLAAQAVDELAPRLVSEILASTNRYRYLTGKLRRIIARAVWTLSQHARQGLFRPLALEYGFGDGQSAPGIKVTLSDGTVMVISGRIDRVDGLVQDDGTWLRVVDYKSGSAGLKMLEVYYGLKLQLLTYLQVALRQAPALCSGRGASPAGILYFPVKDPLVQSNRPLVPAEAEREILRQLRMSGFVVAQPQVVANMDRNMNGHSDLISVGMTKDGRFYKGTPVLTLAQFDALLAHVQRIFTVTGEAIVNGQVDIKPYKMAGRTPCTYCPYHAVCRFDRARPENGYRVIPAVSDEEALRRMAREQKGGDADEHGLD